MPELPEVETVARELHPLVVGRVLRRPRVVDGKLGLTPATLRRLTGARIVQVVRVAKEVAIDLVDRAGRPGTLAVHLRMTGRLRVLDRDAADAERHARLLLPLDDDRVLVFADARRFGVVRLVADHRALGLGGVEPLSGDFTARRLGELLDGARTGLKPWLLRQDRVAGIGNIYASEILFGAGLDPARAAGSLDVAETRRLHRAIRAVLAAAIRHAGTTFADFQRSNGETGGFGRFLRVYGREGEPCRACGAPIRRFVQAGRSTYSCPACQR